MGWEMAQDVAQAVVEVVARALVQVAAQVLVEVVAQALVEVAAEAEVEVLVLVLAWSHMVPSIHSPRQHRAFRLHQRTAD